MTQREKTLRAAARQQEKTLSEAFMVAVLEMSQEDQDLVARVFTDVLEKGIKKTKAVSKQDHFTIFRMRVGGASYEKIQCALKMKSRSRVSNRYSVSVRLLNQFLTAQGIHSKERALSALSCRKPPFCLEIK